MTTIQTLNIIDDKNKVNDENKVNDKGININQTETQNNRDISNLSTNIDSRATISTKSTFTESTSTKSTFTESTKSTTNAHRTETTISVNGYPQITIFSIRDIHSISFELDPYASIALICNLDIKYESPTELAIMLKHSCEILQKSNIRCVMQQVQSSDWLTILKPSGIFKKHSDGNGFLNVICHVEQMPEAIMKALGFEELNSVNDYE